ncbi:hypothetical protein I315_01156 [Cryptococcus gattii Ru294]|uniref:PITH domain-containing protein n=1 Tax=Cryptococcus gattii serotype B (strain WM276 / ATCC MYA-4071) TaxID=367775 RepID=E6R262_CRYGW|nr:uncharacterized protein CGB_C8320C [Cryptococcus gattii WM276]ADV21333.1 hypothetical protein CNBC1430 [Cryptococcus gattii WM276]KIR56091.1 hypothetical protein I315_01156 [Cryptococcus gattii Ru294]
MNCADDLTTDDLSGNVTTEVLERASAGEGATVNLWSHIDRDNVTGLNLENPSSAPFVIKTWDDRLDQDQFVESGVDDDLIIHIPFITSVRLRTLCILPPAPDHPHRSTRLRLYANQPHCPDFGDLESITPVMDIDTSQPPAGIRRLPDGRRDVEEWPLKVQKLANVFSVTLLFTEASTSQRSQVYFIGLKGVPPKHTMDMSKLGTIPTEKSADQSVDGVAQKQTNHNTTTTR